MPAMQFLKQFVAMERCYRDVLAVERDRAALYDWILRVRTDTIHFEPWPSLQCAHNRATLWVSERAARQFWPRHATNERNKVAWEQ
eukprot:7047581-Prymnesium_polylepis.1